MIYVEKKTTSDLSDFQPVRIRAEHSAIMERRSQKQETFASSLTAAPGAIMAGAMTAAFLSQQQRSGRLEGKLLSIRTLLLHLL